jgi:acyl carrier protein
MSDTIAPTGAASCSPTGGPGPVDQIDQIDQIDHAQLLAELLTSHFQVDPLAIVPGATLEDLDLDSLVLVELAVLLERRLGIKIAEGDLRIGQTLDQAADVLAAKRAGS